MQISTELFLLLTSLFLLFFPSIHLILIFLIMTICEWIEKLINKIANLISNFYDIIFYIISNPIVLVGLTIYVFYRFHFN